MVHSVDASQLPQRQVWNVIHGFMLDNAVPREGLSLSVSDGGGSGHAAGIYIPENGNG